MSEVPSAVDRLLNETGPILALAERHVNEKLRIIWSSYANDSLVGASSFRHSREGLPPLPGQGRESICAVDLLDPCLRRGDRS